MKSTYVFEIISRHIIVTTSLEEAEEKVLGEMPECSIVSIECTDIEQE